MVSRITEQNFRCETEENMNLLLIKEVVESRDPREEKQTRERKEKRKEVIGGSTCQSRTAEIKSTVREPDMGCLLAEP